jgi:predicted nucleic acid-binding protein
MTADFPVLLDACVLANQRVTDLLLRLAETPRLFLPYWSDRILDETDRALGKFGWPDDLIVHRRQQLARHFPEASIEGFEPIEACVGNDAKDRHVLAAAIRGKCEIIVTFNLKDFPVAALEPWNIEAHHPSKFLSSLYSLNQALVVQRLHEIAANLRISIHEVITRLAEPVPAFALQVADDIGIELG